MKRNQVVLICFAFLLLTGCVTSRLNTNYKGSDAGDLVVAVGGSLIFDIYYRRVGTTGISAPLGVLHYAPNRPSLFGPPDLEASEVNVHHLEPGNYEIYTYSISEYNGVATVLWSPKEDFSIPFTIASATTTYIGDFTGRALFGRNILGAQVPNGGYFVVSDKQDRDIPIARKQNPELLPVTVSVFDVSRLGLPTLATTESR